ncbi:MAG TPA: hypothetical protein VGG34_13485 [Opitutaceae bacterium]
MQGSALRFNREVLIGELGALVLANGSAPVVSHFTRDASVISGIAVAATLAGGGLSWLAARVYDRVRDRAYSTKTIASDVGYFMPAATVLGFVLYDPTIFLVSRHLLLHGTGVRASVLLGQAAAFALFLAAINGYRVVLLRLRGKAL